MSYLSRSIFTSVFLLGLLFVPLAYEAGQAFASSPSDYQTHLIADRRDRNRSHKSDRDYRRDKRDYKKFMRSRTNIPLYYQRYHYNPYYYDGFYRDAYSPYGYYIYPSIEVYYPYGR